jgi:IS30 family transposase
MKAEGTRTMSPFEDLLAQGLQREGVSIREIGRLLHRSDRTIAGALERKVAPLWALLGSRELGAALSAADKQRLRSVADFRLWIQDGIDRGWLTALMALIRNDGVE